MSNVDYKKQAEVVYEHLEGLARLSNNDPSVFKDNNFRSIVVSYLQIIFETISMEGKVEGRESGEEVMAEVFKKFPANDLSTLVT